MKSKDVEKTLLSSFEKKLEFDLTNEFLQSKVIKHYGEGTINNSCLFELGDGSRKVLTIGPNVISMGNLMSRIDSGYLDSNKFTKSANVSELSIYAGVPAVKFADSGVYKTDEEEIGWGIMEEATGQPLSKFWPEMDYLQKNKICEEFGILLGSIHESCSSREIPHDYSAKKWYQKRMQNLIIDGLTLEIFKEAKGSKILATLDNMLNNLSINDTFGLIHGDLFQGNLFVEKNGSEFKITNIIDWETSMFGHTGYEQILSAWWLAGENGRNIDNFRTIVELSANNGLGFGFDADDALKAVGFVNAFWRLNVIVSCVALKNYVDVPRWINELDTILALDKMEDYFYKSII